MTARLFPSRPPPLPLRDRVVVLGALGALSAWAWLWLLVMPAMDGMAGPVMRPAAEAWRADHFAAALAMWAIMMIGMMVPSAAPMVLLYARVARRGPGAWRAHFRTALFVAGYIAAWTGFSIAATVAQGGLEWLTLLTPMTATASPLAGGALLVAAGLYQLTPAKHACLERCRTPFLFVTERWRPGITGAFVMGLDHGAYCLGCCWMLMALLFVVGVMDLLWVAVIAALILAEKLAPRGPALARTAGVALIALGAGVAISAF